MNKLPKNSNISFAIPAYNCEKIISESVESIFNGNFSNGDEVIIVNDASTDKTLGVAKDLQKKYPAIRIFKHHYNKGSAAAGRNTGIDKSKNELIFCLDADNILCPKSVPKLKEYMLSKKADAAAFGELHFFKKNIKNVTHKWTYRKEVTLYDTINNPQITPCASGNYLFTKESWLKAGRYNEVVSIISIDSWAFGFCQLVTGAKIVTMPNSFYYHRYGYKSTFVKESKRSNASIAILQIILPYLNLLDEREVDYIMSKEGRHAWFDNLKNHPIKLKKPSTKKNNNLITFLLERIKRLM